MEGAAYPPPTQSGYPHTYTTSSGYYPGPQTFSGNTPPPPYFRQPAPPPQAQQQSTSNVVVVQSQPSVIATTIRPVGDHYLTLGVVLTILCLLCGTWHALFCTIPAIIFSTMARDADARGDNETARTHGRIALGLNIGGLFAWTFLIVGMIILAVVLTVSSTASTYSNICYSSYYSYDDGYSYTYSYYCYK